MALQLDYPDAFLSRFCSDDREARAFAEVDQIAGDTPFVDEWRNKLARLRCYVIACLENQAAPDDLFTAKLKSYRAEFDSVLAQAKDSVTSGSGSVLFSIPLERG